MGYATLGFGESLRRLRAEQGLSLSQLGRRAGLSPWGVWAIEQGKSGAFLASALGIAAGLGTTVEAMITEMTFAEQTPVTEGLRFGPSVRAERKARQWTIEDLAVKSGLPVTTVQRIETHEPRLLSAALLASALETSITALAGKAGPAS